jgi:hypothetical protein
MAIIYILLVMIITLIVKLIESALGESDKKKEKERGGKKYA